MPSNEDLKKAKNFRLYQLGISQKKTQTGKKTAQRKPGTGMSPGERKAKTGKAEKIKPKSERKLTKPLRPLTRLEMERMKRDKPFRRQPKNPKR